MYDTLPNEAVLYAEARTTSVRPPKDEGGIPMATSAFSKGEGKSMDKGKHSKGKGFGGNSGGGTKSNDVCHNCGKKGHFAKDCWSTKSSGKGGGSGSDACSICGKQGHKPADCWQKEGGGTGKSKSKNKSANSFDGVQQPQQEPESAGVTTFELAVCSRHSEGALSPLIAEDDGHAWLPLNLDTGAARAVFPPRYAEKAVFQKFQESWHRVLEALRFQATSMVAKFASMERLLPFTRPCCLLVG
jgi:hypothetical protein